MLGITIFVFIKQGGGGGDAHFKSKWVLIRKIFSTLNSVLI